jgi:DNA-binding HxlR family transcriptional regulator
MEIKQCPIENTVKYIGKKWTINILRDLFMGKHRFTEFLEGNKDLSTKMLSQRLKELEKDSIIQKKITNKTPLTIEYHLTKKGNSLNKVVYELAVYSINTCPCEVFKKNKHQKKQALQHAKKTFLRK